jgi:hypothetical protein
LILVAAPVLSAQSVITVPPQQCVWRAGDNPARAAPNLDESGWQAITTWKRQPGQPVFWIRCHADLSPLRSTQNPAIQVELYDAYELYLNGAQIGGAGNFDRSAFELNTIRSFPVVAGQIPSGAATIALRVANRIAVDNSGTITELISNQFQLRAGDTSLLDAMRAQKVLASSSRYLGSAVCFGIIGVMAIMLLGLYSYDRDRRELLYLSVACLMLAAIRLNEYAVSAYLPYPLSVCLVIVEIANAVFGITLYPFFFALANRRMPRVIVILIVITALSYLPYLIDSVAGSGTRVWFSTFNHLALRPFGSGLHILLAFTPFVVFWPYRLISRRVRPLAFLCMLWAFADLIWFLVQLTANPIPGIPNVFAAWGVRLLEVRAFATAGVIAALLGLLFRDQRQATEERAEFAGEMASAREIQQYLIPDKLPPTPGLVIQSVYQPSREVGGDFFQVLPDARDGSTLIIVGDVAGKGLRAGMLAALIVGAIRTASKFTSDPGRILALLNERLQGRGLVTCLALRIDRNGGAQFSNAGHLPPYIDGKEIEIEGSLPLGALPDVSFPSAHLQLSRGESMLFVSDGVIEARNSAGELFGFDRTRAISSQSAESIASAAQAHGQEDDITVLTLTLAPVEVAHA